MLSGTLGSGDSVDGVSIYDYDGSLGAEDGGAGNVQGAAFVSSVTVVPEARTFALALPALAMIALYNRVGVLIKRRKK